MSNSIATTITSSEACNIFNSSSAINVIKNTLITQDQLVVMRTTFYIQEAFDPYIKKDR